MNFILNLLKQILIGNYSENIRYSITTNFEIYYCVFYRSTLYSGYGGIFYCSNIPCNLTINDTIFFKCISSLDGGAIYYTSNLLGSNVYLNRICANNCSTGLDKSYQFCYIVTYQIGNNSCNYLSINFCNTIPNGFTSFYLGRGNISLNNYNSSKNFNKQYSGLYIYMPIFFLGKFCNIINNIVSDSKNIMLYGNSNNKLTFSNILFNNSPNGFGVILNYGGYYSIENCILLNNSNTLFFSNYDTLTILYCIISHLNQIYTVSINGYLNTMFNIHTYTNTINIYHLNTYLCENNNNNNNKISNIYKSNLFKNIILKILLPNL